MLWPELQTTAAQQRHSDIILLSVFDSSVDVRKCINKLCWVSCRCGTSAFKSSSSDWKRKAAADEHTLNEYAELFGSDQAATTEAAETATDEQISNGDTAHGDADVSLSEAAVTAGVDAAQPAAKKRKKSKKVEAIAEADAAVGTNLPVLLSGSQAPVKEKKKRKKAKQQEKTLDDGVITSVSGAEYSDAPWANESVPAVHETGDVGHSDNTTVGKKKKQKRIASKEDVESIGNNATDAGVPINAGEALALLGFASAPSNSKHKKHAKKP